MIDIIAEVRPVVARRYTALSPFSLSISPISRALITARRWISSSSSTTWQNRSVLLLHPRSNGLANRPSSSYSHWYRCALDSSLVVTLRNT